MFSQLDTTLTNWLTERAELSLINYNNQCRVKPNSYYNCSMQVEWYSLIPGIEAHILNLLRLQTTLHHNTKKNSKIQQAGGKKRGN